MVHMLARQTAGLRNDDIEETLRERQGNSRLRDHGALARALAARILARRKLPASLVDAVTGCCETICANEAALLLKAPSSMPDRLTREAVLRGLDDEERALETFGDTIAAVLGSLLDAIELPATSGWATLMVDVPSASRMSNIGALLMGTIERALSLAPDTRASEPVFGVGTAFAGDVMKKVLRASNMSEAEARARPHRLKFPSGNDASSLVATYVGGTALEALLHAPVTLQVEDKHLVEHMMIIGGPGAGKTQTIEAIIARHLERPADDQMGMVIIDSQGDLLKRIMAHRACKDRLIYVDPTDIEHAPALNIFDLGLKRSEGADARTREAIRNGVLELYELTLGDLMASDLSAKMVVPFKFLCTLMLEIPGATLQDLRAVLADLAPYQDAVDRLGETGRRFFERDYNSKTFADTRQQIGWRLDSLLVNAAFERMFAARASKVDLFEALNTGKIVLIHSAKEHLRQEASSIFGRYFIAATLAAIIDRARIPEAQRRPATLIIDEAHEYLSSDVEMLLRQARKYNCGVVLASQTLSDMKPAFRDSLLSCTEIKLAANISDRGAETLAANMKTTSAFVHAQTKTKTHARFAMHVRSLTRTATTLEVPFDVLGRAPQLTKSELAAVLAKNRVALSAPAISGSGGSRKDAPEDMPRRGVSRPAAPGRGRSRSGEDDDQWETY